MVCEVEPLTGASVSDDVNTPFCAVEITTPLGAVITTLALRLDTLSLYESVVLKPTPTMPNASEDGLALAIGCICKAA
jgi:hypothetical protein